MKLLVFQHVAHEGPGYISDWASGKGITLEVIKLWQPYTLPNVLDYSGLAIMGGPMGVYEDQSKFPSKEDELKVIKQAIGKIPVIGFCLGSQLIAHALGAKVYPNVIDGKKVKEIGYYDIELTKAGLAHPIFSRFDQTVTVMQWHGDAFDLPSGAKALASSELCHNQAFAFGEMTVGMIFHMEFTPAMVREGIYIDKKWIHEDFELDDKKFLQAAEDNSDLMKVQCRQLMDNFMSL